MKTTSVPKEPEEINLMEGLASELLATNITIYGSMTASSITRRASTSREEFRRSSTSSQEQRSMSRPHYFSEIGTRIYCPRL